MIIFLSLQNIVVPGRSFLQKKKSNKNLDFIKDHDSSQWSYLRGFILCFLH